MATDNPGVWTQLGTGLTNAPVWDMDYDPDDDTLVAATIGRGVWTLTPVANLGPALSISDVTVTEGNAASVTAVFNVTLAPASAETVTVSFATADGSATVDSNNFSSDSPIDIPARRGHAVSLDLLVSGANGNISKVTVTLHGFDHPWTADVDVLLVGPGGQSVVLMSDVGGGVNTSGSRADHRRRRVSIRARVLLRPGTYQPTNLEDSEGADAYAWPALPAAMDPRWRYSTAPRPTEPGVSYSSMTTGRTAARFPDGRLVFRRAAATISPSRDADVFTGLTSRPSRSP